MRSAAHLGKYRLIAELARGGMGVVHLAVLKGIGGFTKLLVIKELRQELAHDEVFVGMFFDEARIAARLSHPNIVQTLEVGTQEGRHYLAMEYVEGPSLQRFARRAHRRGKPVPLGVHLYLMVEMLSALEYAHSLTEPDGTPTGLVHRDVSPGNVLVTYDGHVKLVDFGIAQTTAALDATHAGALKGKMMFMAPEQAACEPVDRRADVFSAGLVLWEAIVGRQPWNGQADAAILRSLLAGEVPRLRDALPEVDANLMAIVERATCAEPGDRYPTALAMRNDLEKYRAQFDGTGALQVGAMIGELFAEDRERLRGIVASRTRWLGERGGRPTVAPPMGSLAPLMPAPEIDGLLASSLPFVPPESPETHEAANAPLASLAPSAMWIPDAPPRSRRAGPIAAGALLVVAAGLAFAFYGGAGWSALWPVIIESAPTAARTPTNASTSVLSPSNVVPREEHVPLSAESAFPVHEAAGVPTADASAAPAPPHP